MENMFGAIGVIILACGLYCFYCYFKTIKTGVPSDVILISKVDANKPCRDKEAFVKKTTPLVLMLSIGTTLYGLIDVIHSYVYKMEIVDAIAGVLFFIMLIIYMVQTQKYKKQYYL